MLVLVGGFVPDTSNPTNAIWVSSDEGASWHTSILPCMNENRISPSVVNAGHPECLVVAGGIGQPMSSSRDNVWVSTVEVLVRGQWVMVQSLPPPVIENPRAIIHNGNYMIFTVTTNSRREQGYTCRVNSLLQTQFQPQNDTAEDIEIDLWKLFSHPSGLCNMLSFRQELVAVDRTTSIIVRCPVSQQWVKVAEHPQPALFSVSAAVSPNANLILMVTDDAERYSDKKCWVYRATLERGMEIIILALA